MLLLYLATLLVMVLNLFFLTRFPAVFIDEPLVANDAWHWITTGKDYPSIHMSRLDPSTGAALREPNMGFIPARLWGLFLGAFGLGLPQLRWVSWLAGLALLAATAAVGTRFYGPLSGALASLFLVVSWPFLWSSHVARPDIMLAGWVMVPLVLMRPDLKSGSAWQHATAGFVMMLGFSVHPNALVFVIAFGALYFWTYRLRALCQRELWLYGAGVLLGLAVYAVVHILPNPREYLNLLAFSRRTHTMPLMAGSLRAIVASAYAEFSKLGFADHRLDFALVGAALAMAVARRSKSDQALLVVLGTAELGYVLLIGNKFWGYAVQIYPLLMILVAEGMVHTLRQTRAREARGAPAFIVGIALLFVVSSGWHMFNAFEEHAGYDYAAPVAQIEAVVPDGARILADPTWWLGLADHDFQSSWNLTYYHVRQNLGLTEALATMRPDIVIVSGFFRTVLVDEGYYPDGSGFDVYKLPRPEFEAFIASRGEQVLSFSDPWHGEIDVYRIHWDTS